MRMSTLRLESLEDRRLLSANTNYGFEVAQTIGEEAPGDSGSFLVSDFQVGGLNNRGDIAFGGGVGTTSSEDSSFGEGVFLLGKKNGKLIAQAQEPAPGGGVFSDFFLGQISINNRGDVAVPFLLDPFSFPIGANGGLFEYSAREEDVHAVVVPGVTEAPGGLGPFVGVGFQASLNNRGDVAFNGLVTSNDGIHLPDDEYVGLAGGIFVADRHGNITAVTVPGDPAPGGGTFDDTAVPQMNDRGDVSFLGHVESNDCSTFVPQEIIIGCSNADVYVKESTGEIRTIVRAGDATPDGRIIHGAYGQVINNRGDVAFAGGLTPDIPFNVVGVYVHSGGQLIDIAEPGDSMPGGGTFISASEFGAGQIWINNRGDVSFNAKLAGEDGSQESGLYVWSKGQLHLVAKTGTVMPGVGTLEQLATSGVVLPEPPEDFFSPDSGAVMNDHGQLAFGATLADGTEVLLVATPHKGNRRAAVAANTLIGDVNRDGIFDSSDLVASFQTGQYEDALRDNSVDSEVDWNGDGDFDSADLVFAFQSGMYEQRSNTATSLFDLEDQRLRGGAMSAALIDIAFKFKLL